MDTHTTLPSIRVLVAVGCVLLMVPILIVVVLAFSGDGYLKFPPSSFSMQWFERFLGDSRWRASLYASTIIALMTCVISTVLGFLAAYAFLRSGLKAKRLLLSLALTPMIVPHVITAISLYYVSSALGLIGNVVWVAIGHSVLALPIVLLIVLSALQNVDVNLERAALGLGCSPLQVFTKVVIPLSLPGIFSAALFAFLASFDELIVALFLSGITSQTLPVRIWNSLMLEVEPTIAAVSAFLIGVTVVILVVDWAVKRGLSVGR